MPFVNRCGDAPKLQTKTVTPTTSQQIITPDMGYEGLEKIVVNAPLLQTKTVTADGTVTPDEGYVGIEKLIVNTPCYVYESISNANYIDNSGEYQYRLRKFPLEGITDKFTTYPDIIGISLADIGVIKNDMSDFYYGHSLYLVSANRTGEWPDSPSFTLLSNPTDNGFYACSRYVAFDYSNVYQVAPTVIVYADHKTYTGYWVSFISAESCFLIGHRDTDNNVTNTTPYFGGNKTVANTYKAYFIWLEATSDGGN